MEKKNKKKQPKKKQNKLLSILNSYHTILIALIIIIVVVLINYNYVVKSNKVYMFNGTGNYVTIYDGVIALNYDVNLIEGSHITYIKEKDVIVSKYKIGYYVKENDKLIPITVLEDEDSEGFSLKAVLEGISAFNMHELNKNSNHFTKEAKKALNNNLYFVIDATTKDDDTISDITELNINRLSK